MLNNMQIFGVVTSPSSMRRGTHPCCIASCALTLLRTPNAFIEGQDTNWTVEGSTSIGTCMR